MDLCQYPSRNKTRCFKIEAIQIPIAYNKYGDYDPNGLLYVLEDDAQRIQEEAIRRFEMDPTQPYEEVQPLVLRVNLGDTVKIRFRSRLNRRLSIHVQGMDYDVKTKPRTAPAQDLILTAQQKKKSGTPGMQIRKVFFCSMIWRIREAVRMRPTSTDCLVQSL